MAAPRIEIDALLNDAEFLRNANKIQVSMDRLDTLAKKTGLSHTALTSAMSQGARQASMSWTDFRSMYSTVLDVVRVGQKVWEETVSKAQEYDQTIRDVMLTTGATAEASSRLVQVVDDAGVSYSTLKTAMRIASKEGIEPNIQSLMALSDEYLKLSPGVERNQFLLDKFGRSGLEMARVMELGSDAISEMSNNIDDSLIVTQQAIDESEEYRKNIDQLKDSWDGFVVSLGNKVIPAINDSIEASNSWNESMEEAEKITGSTDRRLNTFVARTIEHRKNQLEALAAVEDHGEALSNVLVPALEEAEDATQELADANKEQLGIALDLQKSGDDYAEKNQSLIDKQTELKDKLNELAAQGWSPLSEKVQDVQKDYDDVTTEIQQLADEHKRELDRMVADMTVAQIEMSDGIAGFSESEYEMALGVYEGLGILTEKNVDIAQGIQGLNAAVLDGRLNVENLGAAIELLPSGKSIDVILNIIAGMATNQINYQQQSGWQQSQGKKSREHAAGGSFMIPSSYGNEGFRMGNRDTASGGEMITITPKGEKDNGYKEIIAAIFAARVDESKLARLIREEELKGVR